MNAQTTIPSSIVAGTTVKWTSTWSDYPADSGWTLTVYIAGTQVLNSGNGKAGVANGKSFDFTLAVADTASFAQGPYHWVEIASKAGEEFPVASGQIEVLLNLKGAAAGAAQTTDEKALAAIELFLAGNAPTDIRSYQIAGRSVERWTRQELIGWRAYYEGRVRAAGLPKGKFLTPVKAAFGGSA